MKVWERRWRSLRLWAYLFGGNGFAEEDELCNNNGRCDSNFWHLVETNTAHELNSEDTRLSINWKGKTWGTIL